MELTRKILLTYEIKDNKKLSLNILDCITKTKGIHFIEKNMGKIVFFTDPYHFINFLKQHNVALSLLSESLPLINNYEKKLANYIIEQQTLQERENLLIDLNNENKKSITMKI